MILLFIFLWALGAGHPIVAFALFLRWFIFAPASKVTRS